MSVLVSDRTESKFEAITYSVELHDNVPKKIHHEFLGSLLPFAGFDRNLVSPIQVVGVTDNLLIVHKSFTVIAILTVVNCVRLCYLSIRKGQCLLLCWLGRESGRTPLEFEALL